MKQTNILLAEDNADLLSTLSLILKLHGCEVQTAEDGLAAVGKANSGNFDVILMDIIMPRMNGIDAFRQIRQTNPRAKVILMTAYYDQDKMESALAEGAIEALHKPVDIGQLLTLISRATTDLAIIVADDDRNMAETLARMLQARGYETYVAHSGEHALQIAREKPVHMAFIDVVMPSMNGLETATRLKKLKPGITNVMMTGYRDEVKDIVDRAVATSAVACLYKPFQPSEVMKLISRHACK